MIWTLTWSFVARYRDLYTIHWQTAGRLDAALMRFAETGRGVELLARDNPRQVRLRVAGAEAFLELDPFERIAYIRRIFRRP